MPLRSFLKIDRENGDSSSFENDPSSNGVETSLSFNYNKISVTDQPTTAHGLLGTPQTFTFDVNELKTAAAVSSDIVSSDIVSSAGLSAASAAVPVPASSPLHYFLKIDGVSGDSTVKGFEGWFSVDGYDIGVQNTGSLSSGGGGGAGKAEFSPLTVDIHSLAGLATLFGDVASGRHLTSVELVGARTIEGESLKVYDVKLSEVLVSSFENDPSSNGVETSLSFNYNKISVTDQPTTAHGLLGTPQTVAFDLSENKIAGAVSPTDMAFEAQINQMAASLASFMASSQLGSSGLQDLVPTPPTQQDQHLPTLAATHS
jgi:type VI protein secretion system component Hcp